MSDLVCQCQTDIENPGPHIAACPNVDPDYVPEWFTPKLTAREAFEAARDALRAERDALMIKAAEIDALLGDIPAAASPTVYRERAGRSMVVAPAAVREVKRTPGPKGVIIPGLLAALRVAGEKGMRLHQLKEVCAELGGARASANQLLDNMRARGDIRRSGQPYRYFAAEVSP